MASRDRAIRLRWLLNALEEQTLPAERWEVVVAHDSIGPETEQLLRSHPLAEAGVLPASDADADAVVGEQAAKRRAGVPLARR